VVAEYDGEGSF